MKILFIGLQWPPETFLLRLTKGLADQGYQIILATSHKPSSDWLKLPNRQWYWKPSWNIGPHLRFFNMVLLAAKSLVGKPKVRKVLLQQLLNRNNVKGKIHYFYQLSPLLNIQTDIVYFPWVLGAADYIDFFNTLAIPVIVSLRGAMVNVDPWVPKRGEQVKHDLSTIFSKDITVHCVSQDILEEAIQYGLDRNKAVVIRPAVDPEFFIPLSDKIRNSRLKIITTGSLIWRKGYEYALMAIKLIIDKGMDAEFHIIGDGPERQRILYTTADLGLDGRVVLHGKLKPEEIRNHLQQSDIFLLSSLSEGISNAVLEAMSCGLPVVTTDCGGMREAVNDGVEGFVVPVRDPDAMAEAILLLANDPGLQNNMGTAAREHVLKEFNSSRYINEWTRLLNQLQSASLK